MRDPKDLAKCKATFRLGTYKRIGVLIGSYETVARTTGSVSFGTDCYQEEGDDAL